MFGNVLALWTRPVTEHHGATSKPVLLQDEIQLENKLWKRVEGKDHRQQ